MPLLVRVGCMDLHLDFGLMPWVLRIFFNHLHRPRESSMKQRNCAAQAFKKCYPILSLLDLISKTFNQIHIGTKYGNWVQDGKLSQPPKWAAHRDCAKVCSMKLKSGSKGTGSADRYENLTRWEGKANETNKATTTNISDQNIVPEKKKHT